MPYLADKALCTGCTACISACPVKCIEMTQDEYGFAYPAIVNPDECIACGECGAVCPVQMDKQLERQEPLAFAAYSNNLPIRMESSSGGIFSEIAGEVIKKGGVVFGAKYDENFSVCHTQVDNTEDLPLLRGAKYAESWLGDTFIKLQKELKRERQVLFTGTPCQVAGLKAFLGTDYSNLLCIDFVCHGVPSPAVWENYVRYRAENDANGELPERINLRDKRSGWSRYQYSNYFKYPSGIEHRDISTQSVFMKLFTRDYISRLSCENCQFKGYNRVSDITLGDFWGIWDVAPEMDDNCGTSVVLIQSEKGLHAWNSIKERVRFKPVDIEETSRQNQSIIESSKAKKERAHVLDLISKEGMTSAGTCIVLQDSMKMAYDSFYNKYVKRFLDVTITGIALCVLWPLILIISLIVMSEDGRPVFYRAERGGYLGRPFRICKFRTMVKDAEKLGGGTTAYHDPRITKTGMVLRKTKLDELPQIGQVFLGKMSLVGPRPELLQYVNQYKGEEKDILKVRPGITDFSSIEFINLDEIVGEENADQIYEDYVLKKKNALRVKYAHQVSFRTDAYILFKTIGAVFAKAFGFLVKKDHR